MTIRANALLAGVVISAWFVAGQGCSTTPCTGSACAGGGGAEATGGGSAGGASTGGGHGGGGSPNGGGATGGGAAGGGTPSDGGITQSQVCADYLMCAYANGVAPGSFDSTYGPQGTCWTTGAAAADACTSACQSGLVSLRAAFPDAGAACPFVAPQQSTLCAHYLACAYAVGSAAQGTLDSTYGPTGTCWSMSETLADSCTVACSSAIAALQTEYPDAGTACMFGIAPTAICDEFVACYAATGSDPSVLVSTYGPDGTCWTSGQQAADACTSACQSAVASLQTAFPDAGPACQP